tara:strand:+ start:1299 stop:1442 length:144 start_codon:yes stop_codon:yes gene_type:complete
MDDVKVLDELLEIIWGSKPNKKGYITKPKKPRDKKGRYTRRKNGSSK